MSFDQKIVHALFWASTASWLRISLAALSYILIARFIGPEALGIVAMTFAIVSLTRVLLGEAVTESLIQKRELEARHKDTMFWSLAIGSSLVFLLLWAAAGPIARYYGEPVVAIIMPWAMLSVVFTSLRAVPMALLRRDLKFHWIGLAETSAEVLAAIAGIGLALAGYGVWSLVALYVVRNFVAFAVTIAFAKWTPGAKAELAAFRELFGFNSAMVINTALYRLQRELPVLIAGPVLGATLTGYISAAQRLAVMLADLTVLPLAQVAMPGFSSLSTNAAILKLNKRFMTLAALIVCPAFIGLICVAPQAVPLILGAEYAPAVPVVQLQALVVLCIAGAYFNSTVLRAKGRPDLQAVATLVSVIMTAVFVYAMKDAGVLAVAVAVAMGYYFSWPVILYAVKYLTGASMTSLVEPFGRPLIAASVMAAAVLGWIAAGPIQQSPLAMMMAAIVLGALAYGAAVLVFARRAIDETITWLKAWRSETTTPRGAPADI
ncbi:MAG: oligosaccharide flippase family protein [Pseudomonadota bacterium]